MGSLLHSGKMEYKAKRMTRLSDFPINRRLSAFSCQGIRSKIKRVTNLFENNVKFNSKGNLVNITNGFLKSESTFFISEPFNPLNLPDLLEVDVPPACRPRSSSLPQIINKKSNFLKMVCFEVLGVFSCRSTLDTKKNEII